MKKKTSYKKIVSLIITTRVIPNRPSFLDLSLRHSPRRGKKRRMSMNMPNEPPCLPIKSVLAPLRRQNMPHQ